MSRNPTPLHLALGSVLLFVIMAMAVVGGMPWYKVHPSVLLILACMCLILLGMGFYVEVFLKHGR